MFSFLRRRREQAAARAAEDLARQVLTECQTELDRTAKANFMFVAVDRDMAQRAALLERAVAAGVADNPVVQKLSYFQRLLTALNAGPDLQTIDVLMTEAQRFQIAACNATRKLAALAEAAFFEKHGLRVLETDAQGRSIYLRCQAEFKNKRGSFEVRTDGLCFRGEVLIDLPWDDVVHVAATSHTYQGLDYMAMAVQEGKRRTPTKFAFPNHSGAEHACKVVLAAWERAKQQPLRDATTTTRTDASTQSVSAEAWTGHGYLGIVGESHYQDALALLAQKGGTFNATLVPEPENPFDSNAVIVQIDGTTVGHLSRTDARRYQRRLLTLAAPIQVPAKLIGGTAEKPNYGVLLDHRDVERLPAPKRKRAKKQQPIDPTDQPF